MSITYHYVTKWSLSLCAMDGFSRIWHSVVILLILRLSACEGSGIYSITVKDITGNDVPLSIYKGKILLIVNVASECGYTAQHYTELVQLQHSFKRHDLLVLAFPCNQFGSQEPKRNSAIARFVRENYKINFPMFSKIKVSGDAAHPLFKLLAQKTGTEPQWNFYKYLVDRGGLVKKVWPPLVSPMQLYAEISQAVNMAVDNNFKPFSVHDDL